MSQLPSLITDLAVILILGSVFSLICKILKQPVVLGYIVAGFIAGPHFAFFQTVDPDNISTWADIGVIFLLFGMGLEFSFKKLIHIGKVGGKAMLFEAVSLSIVGFFVGKLIGWNTADSLLLGSMLIMSSTAIIFKAFNDLGVQKAKFANIVFGILVFEDLFAIIIMVLITTLAASKKFEGMQLAGAMLKLGFVLIVWVVAGIYLIPTFFKKLKKYLNNETLLLISMGLCLGMVVLATSSGFSSALGAFIMGSILAETLEQERIEKVIAPIKDFFGAIFFVSVGMMVDPIILKDNFMLVIIIAMTSVLGKMIFSTTGVRLTGQDLKTSMQTGFSLTQMGEFSFIVAAMGISLGVTSAKIYPIVIAVSVLTTFTTPYCILLAVPAYRVIEAVIPKKWSRILYPKSIQKDITNNQNSPNNIWKQFVSSYFKRLGIYIIICIAILLISFTALYPLAVRGNHNIIKRIISTLITLICLSPIIRGMIHNVGKQAYLYLNLWTSDINNRFILAFFIVFRYLIAIVIVFAVMHKFLNLPIYIVVIATFICFAIIFNNKSLLKYYWHIESRFVKNFNARQIGEYRNGENKLSEINNLHWIDRNMYFAEYDINENSLLNGKSLKNLNFRNQYNLLVISVERNRKDFDFPDGDFSLMSGDKLWILGTLGSLRKLDLEDESVSLDYNKILTLNDFNQKQTDNPKSVIHCLTFHIEKGSEWIGNSLMDSTLMQNKCVVIAIERDDAPIINPSSHTIFKENDMVWVMGDKKILYKLLERNYFEKI